MSTLTRRGFARRLLMAAFVPFVRPHPSLAQSTSPTPSPETIGGHVLTEEEQTLVASFLANQEQAMQPLRSVALPNSLPPVTSFRAPRYGGSKERS